MNTTRHVSAKFDHGIHERETPESVMFRDSQYIDYVINQCDWGSRDDAACRRAATLYRRGNRLKVTGLCAVCKSHSITCMVVSIDRGSATVFFGCDNHDYNHGGNNHTMPPSFFASGIVPTKDLSKKIASAIRAVFKLKSLKQDSLEAFFDNPNNFLAF